MPVPFSVNTGMARSKRFTLAAQNAPLDVRISLRKLASCVARHVLPKSHGGSGHPNQSLLGWLPPEYTLSCSIMGHVQDCLQDKYLQFCSAVTHLLLKLSARSLQNFALRSRSLAHQTQAIPTSFRVGALHYGYRHYRIMSAGFLISALTH